MTASEMDTDPEGDSWSEPLTCAAPSSANAVAMVELAIRQVRAILNVIFIEGPDRATL